MESKIKQIQTAIFIRNFNIANDLERAGILTEINQHAHTIFDGQPTQLPIPVDAPQEIPRFILNSADGRFSCNIALSRVDVFYNVLSNSIEGSEQLFEAQRINIQNIFDFLIEKSVIVNRIGFITVVTKILEPGEGNGLDFLKGNFIQNDKLNQAKELTFNYNRSGRSENFEMNNLVTLNAKADTVINMQTDVNTVAEIVSVSEFNSEDFNEIINYSIQETQMFVNNFPNI